MSDPLLSCTGLRRTLRIGLVTSPGQVATRLDAGLAAAEGVEVERYDNLTDLRRAVRRFSVAAGVVVPPDADQRYCRCVP